MQEYCKSDKGRRRRLDRANAAKKQKQQGQWDQSKGWQNHPPKQANRQINNLSASPYQNQNRAEAAAAKPASAGRRRKVFLLAPWDRRPAPHPSMPFGNQKEVGMGG
jgi:hypothetical protein